MSNLSVGEVFLRFEHLFVPFLFPWCLSCSEFRCSVGLFSSGEKDTKKLTSFRGLNRAVWVLRPVDSMGLS